MDWYCVHTKPLKEAQVADYLHRNLGLETFYPKLKRRKTIRRVKRVVISPLFPRYEFCRFDLGSHFRAVRYAPDVIDVVNLGDRPQVVDESIIRSIREWAGDGVDIVTIRPPLKPGEKVAITDGPMRGLHAVIVQDMPDSDRVAVLLDLLGCGARLVVDRAHLERTGPEPGPAAAIAANRNSSSPGR